MPPVETSDTIDRGISCMESGDFLSALVFLEKAARRELSPLVASHLAVCLARERGQVQKALALCRDALEKEPENNVHYLNMGRIHLIRGDKPEAINCFRAGLAHGRDQRLISELDRLGTRRPPVIPFLRRTNPLNRYLGKLMHRLGLR